MVFSRKSSDPSDGHEPQDAWSSTFPPDYGQPFDQNPFSRMDFSVPPALDHEFVRSGARARLPRCEEAPEAASLNHVPFRLDRSLSPAHVDQAMKGGSYTANSPVHPPRGDGPYDMHDLGKPSKPRQLHRAPLRGEITPYLGLRARLSQIPINRWSILLLLVLARMLILFAGLINDFTSAKQEVTTACAKVEDIGSTLASMPYYMSRGGMS